MTPEDRYHFEPLVMSVESAIARGESVGQYHHSEVLRLLRAALAAEAVPLDGVMTDCPLSGIHQHSFRGPHRFREWEPGT